MNPGRFSAPMVNAFAIALIASAFAAVHFSTSGLAANESTGKAIYGAKCAICHGASGQGTTSAVYSAPPLARNAHVTTKDPRGMIVTIVNGMRGPLDVPGHPPYNGVMPAWKGQLSNADVAAVATYVRSSWGNNAPAVTEHEVAATGAPVQMMIGASIYTNRCMLCHGAKGHGRTGVPSLAGNARVIASDPSAMILTIENGGSQMPGWRSQLSDADIAAVATYVRRSFGNRAAPVTDGDVVSVSTK